MLKKILFLLAVYSYSVDTIAQFNGFSSEIGIILGPVAFQSDYGERKNLSTTTGNTGFGIGIVHYMNFSGSGYNYTRENYFEEHFKIRSEISYSKSELQHFGRWVDKESTSLGVAQLKAMRGSTTVTNLGMQFEFYPFSIDEFGSGDVALAPYLSFGAQYSFYTPKAYSTLGTLGDPLVTFPKYLDPSEGKPNGFTNDSGTVWSVVGSIGTRYKISPLSDVLIDLRFQQYFSNWVDGLNPNPDKYPENKANDWIVWFSVGYVYSFDD